MYKNGIFLYFPRKTRLFVALLGLTITGITGCDQKKAVTFVYADLSAFGQTDATPEMQFEAFQAGGGGIKKEQAIVWQDVSCSWETSNDAPYLEINVPGTSGYLEGSVRGLNLPENWAGFDQVLLETRNPGQSPVALVLTVYGPRNILTDTILLSAGQERAVALSLLDLPLAAGNQPLNVPNKIRIAARAERSGFSVTVRDLRLRPDTSRGDVACVDAFGQRIRGNWYNKINDSSQLIASKIQEEKLLAEVQKNDQWGRYFGLKSGKKFDATGYFRLEKEDNREGGKWWLITPDGWPFWSLGVTCIRPSNNRTAVTNIKGREFLFEQLPSRNGRYGDAYTSDSTISLYRLNLLKKYGTIDAWRDRALERVKKWGLNSIGNWTEDSVVFKRKIPYTYSFRTNEKPGLKMGKGLCDVFSGEWMQYTDSILSRAVTFKNDPLLIGYFIDNEAGWGNMKLLEIAPRKSALREKWMAMMQKKYKHISALNEAWDTGFGSWQEVAAMSQPQGGGNDIFHTDYLGLEKAFAEQYFSFISNTLKKYDPNHLYLGCRFTRRLKPDHILATAGRYCDVITVNVYSLVPERDQMTQWHLKTGRPLLIGEHHLPLRSERQLPPRYRAFTQEERHKYYVKYVKTFAEMPFSLGCHWYQFNDQHLTGRLSNGENQVIGLVDITDQPHKELTEAIGICSKKIYEWHESPVY